MVLFGPSGTCDEVAKQKLNKQQHAEYLVNVGLGAFEYPFTFGVNINAKSAEEIKSYFAGNNIKLSVHAPYYINFASADDLQIEKSNKYLLDSVLKAKEIGADRVVFHPGALTKQTREVALQNCIKNLANFVKLLDENNITDIYICPETMGKHGQIGTYEEVAQMCEIDYRIIPTLDFGHINAFTLGGLTTVEDYDKIFDLYINKLGKTEIQIHFSRIEFTPKGEKRHLIFGDESEFGPDYKQMLESIKKYDANFRIICESAGTQTKDSVTMKEYFKKVF